MNDLRVRNRYKTAASLEQVGGRVAGSRVIIGNHIFPAKLDPGIYVATALVHVGRVSSKFSLSHTNRNTLNQWLELVSKHRRAWDIISKVFLLQSLSVLFFSLYLFSYFHWRQREMHDFDTKFRNRKMSFLTLSMYSITPCILPHFMISYYIGASSMNIVNGGFFLWSRTEEDAWIFKIYYEQ